MNASLQSKVNFGKILSFFFCNTREFISFDYFIESVMIDT